MRVLYDGIVFQNSYQRGIQRAFRELISHMPEGIRAVVALTGAPKCPLPQRATIARLGVPGTSLLPRALRTPLQSRFGARGVRRLAANADVFHSTYFTLAPADLPSVLHVHDLLPEQFPECFDAPWAAREIQTRADAIERATRVVAISDATARQIARFYPLAIQKTTTIHWGCNHLARHDGVPKSNANTPYVLHVGDRAGYKNFSVILDAMESPRWPRELGLTIVGPEWRESELSRVDRLCKDRVVRHLGRASDQSLAALYASTRCLIAPSLGEGFGFPILEAQTLCAPVVCADTPVFREIAGDAALFFDPRDPSQLLDRVLAIGQIAARARAAERARWNLTRFSWERCAARTAELYADALSAAR